MGSARPTDSSSSCATRAPVSPACSKPASSGRWVPVAGYSRPSIARKRPPTWKRCLSSISAADLLSRAPAEPQLSSAWISPRRPLRPADPHRQHVCVGDVDLPSAPAPGSRCRHPRPRVTSQLTLRPPAAATITAPTGVPDLSGIVLASALSAVHEPSDATTGALLIAVVKHGEPHDSTTTRTCLSRPTSMARDPQARGTFRQQVPPPRPPLSRRSTPKEPPPVPWFCHRRSGVRHAFTHHRVR